MKHLLVAGLLALALAGCRDQQGASQGNGSVAANEPGETEALLTVGGTVVEAQPESVTVQTLQGEVVELELDPDVQVMHQGRRVDAGSISEGASVRAAFREQDGQNVAHRVDIDRRPPAETGEPPSPTIRPGTQGMEQDESGATPAEPSR